MNLVDKYAIAVLNIYDDRLNFEAIKRIQQAVQFLQDRPRILFLLQIPIIKQEVKQEKLIHFCDRFGLGEPIKNLIRALLNHKRASLLAEVLKAIVYHYEKRHNRENIIIKSSIPLPEKYRQVLEHFVACSISGIKEYHYEVDPRLIAGVRIQSDTMLWECSIDKRLRDIAHASSW